MKPRINVWIDVDGKVALSLWRINLLKIIANTGSISAAAEELGIPYRTAWMKVHEMEERLGVQLLETQAGGLHGGGAHLTPAAEAYVQKLEALLAAVTPFVERSFARLFSD